MQTKNPELAIKTIFKIGKKKLCFKLIDPLLRVASAGVRFNPLNDLENCSLEFPHKFHIYAHYPSGRWTGKVHPKRQVLIGRAASRDVFMQIRDNHDYYLHWKMLLSDVVYEMRMFPLNIEHSLYSTEVSRTEVSDRILYLYMKLLTRDSLIY